jgi:hypothetical protein
LGQDFGTTSGLKLGLKRVRIIVKLMFKLWVKIQDQICAQNDEGQNPGLFKVCKELER